jgi:hypothetical protein
MFEASQDNDISAPGFTFFTNHAHVLLLIAQQERVRMRELATIVGITERAVQRIVDDLSVSGYLSITKEGRRNRYHIQTELPMRHPIQAHRNVGDLIHFVFPSQEIVSALASQEPGSAWRWPQPGALRSRNTDQALRTAPDGMPHGAGPRSGRESESGGARPQQGSNGRKGGAHENGHVWPKHYDE